jgi:uncharacterized CHY-type Zn-finger protein
MCEMFEDFLNHTCDIYHTVDETVTIGYGIGSDFFTCYPCHFLIFAVPFIRTFTFYIVPKMHI